MLYLGSMIIVLAIEKKMFLIPHSKGFDKNVSFFSSENDFLNEAMCWHLRKH